MKSYNGGIRDLFRYCVAILYSVAIVPYMIGSFFALFLGNPSAGINEDSLSDAMVAYIGEMDELSDNNEVGDKNKSGKGNELKSDNIMLSMNTRLDDINQHLEDSSNSQNDEKNNTEQEKDDTTNQFLQNGDDVNTQESGIEENDEEENNDKATKGDQFDIEKIISDLHLQKEKRVAVVAKNLGIDRNKEKLDYAKFAGIQGEYNGSLEQNQKIRDYLIYNAQEIYKEKHGWNEWDNLPLVAKAEKKVTMNEEEIKGQMTYNDVTLKVSAPAGSFPEGTVLKIKTLEDDDSMTTFDITLKEVILMTQVDNVEYNAPMASFDISFYAPDDTECVEELQPAEGKSISVTFDYANNKQFKNPEDEGFLAIYHMEDYNETSVANLVSIKDSADAKGYTKSNSMSIYANTLSVYILTIVSDFDEESEGTETIKFDAGYGGFIVDSEDIVLSSTGTEIDAIYTGKILAKNNEITLPEVQVTSGHTFGGWFSGSTFLGNPGSIFNLWNFKNSESDEPVLDSETDKNSYEVYACWYIEGSNGNICTLNDNLDSDLIFEESLDTENKTNVDYIPSEEEIEKYGKNVFVAYNWALNNGITTINDVSQVKFNKKITRAELAKMMVAFMSGTLEKTPITTGEVNYKDVDSAKLGNLTGYIELAYQYQIMGINADGTPMENFYPDKTVTRAEFATVLSRVLYGNTYNQNGKNYYEKHIEALEKANILKNTNPDLVETRGWIMMMLYNTQNNVVNSNNQSSLS